MPVKVILPVSDSFPVTRFSSAREIWVKAPSTGVEPREAATDPPTTTPDQVILPSV